MDQTHPLKEWRTAEDRRMTLVELAALIEGVTPSHLSEIENGNNEPSLELAVRISAKTGIEVSQFVGRRKMKASA